MEIPSPVGTGTVLPGTEHVKQKVSPETSSEARPFTVALYRPAASPRPPLLKWQRNATQDHDYLIVQLPPGEPWRVVVDGHRSLDDRSGQPWPPGLPSALTIHAVANAQSIATIGVCIFMCDPQRDSLFIVPIARQPFEADLDGQRWTRSRSSNAPPAKYQHASAGWGNPRPALFFFGQAKASML